MAAVAAAAALGGWWARSPRAAAAALRAHLYVASRSMEGVTPRMRPPRPSSRTMAAMVAVSPGGAARSAVVTQPPLAAAAAAASSLCTCILQAWVGAVRQVRHKAHRVRCSRRDSLAS